ncbi:MAG: UbiA family prenyltransferase [Methanomassiliicoccales archaeon]|nr:MAG: UbiA family prenyltransferase [Methanomassiliicoccales archaeon]
MMLFVVGFLFHVYGFVLNDCIDIKRDALSRDLAERPIVKGTISLKSGLAVALSAIILVGFLCIVIFNFFAFITILVAALLGAIYNVFSKKFIGMDILLGGSIFFLVLTGSISTSLSLTTSVLLVALLGGIQVVGMNVIYGGLKDAKHDFLSGAKTIALYLGVRIDDNHQIRIPRAFMRLSYLLQSIHVSFALAILVIVMPKNQFWMMGGFLLLSVLLFHSLASLLALKLYQREKIREKIAYYVASSHILAVFVMLPIMPFFIALLAILPLAWFFISNIALYKTLLNPHTQ